MDKKQELIDALCDGNQITNGTQFISWNSEIGQGYMSCWDDGCCEHDFDSIEDISDYINRYNDEWRKL